MARADMAEHTERVTLAAHMRPVEFQVICPACDAGHAVERVEEDFEGFYSPADESRFILCACGCNIEVLPCAIGAAEGSQ